MIPASDFRQAPTECELTLASLRDALQAAALRCQLLWMVWLADAWTTGIAASFRRMDWCVFSSRCSVHRFLALL